MDYYFLCITAVIVFLAYVLSDFFLLIVRQQLSPLRRLPGPPAPSFFMGNLIQMFDQENNNLVHQWEATYGSNFVYRGFIGGCRLLTTDLLAVAYILNNAYHYPKPEFIRDTLENMAAGPDGLITVEGDTHRRQRKILSSAFTSPHIKSLHPIFRAKAIELRDIWVKLAEESENRCSRVDVQAWLGRAGLDVIGLAGFGYAFDSLTDTENELANAFATIFQASCTFSSWKILEMWFPCLRRFRRNSALINQARTTMRRIGLKLIEECRAEVAAEATAQWGAGSNGNDSVKPTLSRDILSVLVRSNMATVPSQRMAMPEILSQIATFITAGHETTSSALTWCLYALSQSPLSQRKLRAAVRALDVLSPTLDDEIMGLPYLDWVVRECLRLHAPITTTMRACMRDEDVIPVAEPFEDRGGVMRSAIRVKKWDMVSIPIQAINKSKKLWGEDALVFRPERWECPPEEIKAIPGLYSNMLTFLHGNRACIGYKFALSEIKIFLCVLVRDIEFLMDSSTVIEKKANLVTTRPFVKSEPELGSQMPLLVRPVSSGMLSSRSAS